MVVNASQMDRLNQAKLREFETFMTGFLSDEFPALCAARTPDQIRDRIREHMNQARGSSITDENSVAKFIYLKWLLGENFERLPDPSWLIGLLNDSARPALHRMEIAMAGVVKQTNLPDEDS